MSKKKKYKILFIICLTCIAIAFSLSTIHKLKRGEGSFIAKQGNMCFFVNSNCERIANFNAQYIDRMSDDSFRVYNGLWGYLDENMKSLIEYQYKDCGNFSKGIAPVFDGEKWFYVDKENRKVFEEIFSWAGEFCNGLAPVKKNEKFYIIDAKGNILKGPFLMCVRIHKDSYFVQSESLGYMFIDSNGNEELPDCNEFISPISITDEYVIYTFREKGELFTRVFSRKNNRVVMESPYSITPVNGKNAFYKSQKDGITKWGILNSEYEQISEPTYEDVISNSEKLYPIKLKNKWGAIDESGKIVIDCKYDKMSPFRRDYASIYDSKTKQWGIIDTNGDIIIDTKYEYITYAF